MSVPPAPAPAPAGAADPPPPTASPGPGDRYGKVPTRLTDAGRHLSASIVTASPPVYRASTVIFESLDAMEHARKGTATGERHFTTYATVGTPTTFALTDALADIEGAGHACRAALMPSGLSAITTALLAFLKTGDHLLMADTVYGPARMFAQGMLARLGVQTTFYDPAIDAPALAALIRPATRVIYLESPGSYTFEVQDVPAICAMARARGLVTMIDNAWASPVFARPLDWGVDLSILPLTKYWSGHADVLMGAVVIREQHWPALWFAIRQLGLCVGGDDASLILRGLRTADVRMRRHESSALAVARWLQGRPEVARVLHPALPEHPRHALWLRDFSGSSGLFSFELDQPGGRPISRAQLAALCDRRRYFRIGASWGGFESLILPAALGQFRSVQPWTGGPLVRLHIGLEDPQDLIDDLADGFAGMGVPP